jgi:hypothetical protein
MTEQHKAKMVAGRQAQLAAWAGQTIEVDENWKVVRSDELNWEIQYKGRFYGYYSNIPQCFNALASKMLDEVAKGKLNEVVNAQNAICEKISKALERKIEDIR